MSEIILHLTAGEGPQACRWVVGWLARAFMREAQAMGLTGGLVQPRRNKDPRMPTASRPG